MPLGTFKCALNKRESCGQMCILCLYRYSSFVNRPTDTAIHCVINPAADKLGDIKQRTAIPPLPNTSSWGGA